MRDSDTSSSANAYHLQTRQALMRAADAMLLAGAQVIDPGQPGTGRPFHEGPNDDS